MCGESFEGRLIAYLTSRLTALGLDAEEGTNRLYFKAAGVPGPISYDQFLKVLLGSHGQSGSGLRRAAGVSAKIPYTNQCTRPMVMRTVISSPYDLIWDGSTTLSISEGGLRRGESNSSKACLGTVCRIFSQLDGFRLISVSGGLF